MPIIKLRGGTAAEWTEANPVLANRELGFETDTKKAKVGDGSTAWNLLGYVFQSSGGVTDHGQLTGLSDADHPISAIQGLQAELNSKEVAGAVLAHATATDPHPNYLTLAEADALYTKTYSMQEVRWDPTNSRWRYNGGTVTIRPTTPAYPDGLVVWNTSTDPNYSTPPPLAVVGDQWIPHGSVHPIV